jgi:hypothetical protein
MEQAGDGHQFIGLMGGGFLLLRSPALTQKRAYMRFPAIAR